MSGAIDFDAVRAAVSIEDYCASKGIELRRAGRLLQARCPLHEDGTPSFTVYPDGRFKCFGCGAHGDVVDLHAKLRGISVGDAVRELSNGTAPTSTRPASPKVATPRPPYTLTDADLSRMKSASNRLAEDGHKCAAIAQTRCWNPSTVRELALAGDLGIEREWLLFGFSHGIKARKLGAKQFTWFCGNQAGECWRQSLMNAGHKTVVIAEGEMDAIRFIDAGYENDGVTLVIGMPGVEGIPAAAPFAGKDVLIAPDMDEAGRRAVERLADSLGAVAASISLLTHDAAFQEEVRP